MTAALEGGEWPAARPGRILPPGKIRYPFYRRLGGPQSRSGRAENLVPTGIRSQTAQTVVAELPGLHIWNNEKYIADSKKLFRDEKLTTAMAVRIMLIKSLICDNSVTTQN